MEMAHEVIQQDQSWSKHAEVNTFPLKTAGCAVRILGDHERRTNTPCSNKHFVCRDEKTMLMEGGKKMSQQGAA